MYSNHERASKATFKIIDHQEAFDGALRRIDIQSDKAFDDLELFTAELTKFLKIQILELLKKKVESIVGWIWKLPIPTPTKKSKTSLQFISIRGNS